MSNLFSDISPIEVKTAELIRLIEGLPLDEKVTALNAVKLQLHAVSPFKNEPVDCVLWVKNEYVAPNNYNPNAVAPPEMKLLSHSIEHDGYTQPVVSFEKTETDYEVVDGFHRTRVGKEIKSVKKRVHGYIPLVCIKSENQDDKDRMASTIRHNRARGKHGIAPMANIVKEMYLKGWSDEQIAKEVGMDKEEVLRLKQFNGLPSLFKDRDFSKAWE
jgi:ParB-like chromosome segregation protein Spo0J